MNNYNTDTDTELLQKIGQDDARAFTQLYGRHWENLFNTAYKRLKQEDPCKDIVQDIFTDVWNRRASLQIENVSAYLHTAVRFQVFKYFARHKLSAHFIQPFENMVDASLKADCNINEKELNLLLKSWMETLPQKRQHIYRLHVQEQLTTKEIASRLCISQKTVQNQLGTSMQSLRAKLAQILSFFM